MALIRTCDNCGKEITPFGYVQISDYGVGGEGGGTAELCPDCGSAAVNVKAVREGLKKDRKRRAVVAPPSPGEPLRGDVTETV